MLVVSLKLDNPALATSLWLALLDIVSAIILFFFFFFFVKVVIDYYHLPVANNRSKD